ncbi:GPR endopeptidase [Lentibacillus halophilus]|uniref:Germination protease n=1 Tax=Lentibacillus halophilus TaxID=295065 RepID=A0ABN0ZC25_9BACI
MNDEDQRYHVRTDLAVEAKDMVVEKNENKTKNDIEGVTVQEKQEGDIAITYVDIDGKGEKQIGKKQGSYITIYADGVKNQDTVSQKEAAKVFSKELKVLMQKNGISPSGTGLIVGLGNWNVTPDALGPMAIEKTLVTSHLFALEHESVSEGYRSVAAVTPGVMGVTGIETSNIIFGITEKFNPDFVIAIDALASRSVERVNETIQMSDAGIHPGSGVGNKRKELSKETLGVPVLAIGCPTVVDAVTITSDTIDFMLKHLGKEWREKDSPSKSLTPAGLSFGSKELKDEDLPNDEQRKTFFGMVGGLSEEEKKSLIKEVLTPLGHNLMVTPKEVDGLMNDMAFLISTGLNAALHERVTVDNAASYTR